MLYLPPEMNHKQCFPPRDGQTYYQTGWPRLIRIVLRVYLGKCPITQSFARCQLAAFSSGIQQQIEHAIVLAARLSHCVIGPATRRRSQWQDWKEIRCVA
jgi:hypothetical protein